jgi:hypothetical protein
VSPFHPAAHRNRWAIFSVLLYRVIAIVLGWLLPLPHFLRRPGRPGSGTHDDLEVGASVTANETYAEVESVKAVSDVFAPLSGEVVAVNEALGDAPEHINADPYGDGWLVKVKLSDPSQVDGLLDVDAYRKLLQG